MIFQQKGLCKLINATGYRIDVVFDGKPVSILIYFWVTFLCMVQVKLERNWDFVCVCVCVFFPPMILKHLTHFWLISFGEEQNAIVHEPKE